MVKSAAHAGHSDLRGDRVPRRRGRQDNTSVAADPPGYLKLWLGIVIVTDMSLVGWLLGNFRSALNGR